MRGVGHSWDTSSQISTTNANNGQHVELDNPDPDKREGYEENHAWLSMRAGYAEDIAYHLETNWRLKRVGMKAHPAAGVPAVCGRMLAVILASLEKVDGLNWEPTS